MASTVTLTGLAVPEPGALLHTRLVEEVYAVLEHTVSPRAAVLLKSIKPKLVPLKVMLLPPEVGVLTNPTTVTTGAL